MWFIKCVYSVGIFYKLNVWFEINYNERLELKKKEYDSVQNILMNQCTPWKVWTFRRKPELYHVLF